MSDDLETETRDGERRMFRTGYKAYLVRCWEESDSWRYSLELIGRGERQGFESVAALLAALKHGLEGGHDQ